VLNRRLSTGHGILADQRMNLHPRATDLLREIAENAEAGYDLEGFRRSEPGDERQNPEHGQIAKDLYRKNSHRIFLPLEMPTRTQAADQWAEWANRHR
jgi:hypothetical protein